MILSMTGFGKGESTHGAITASAEIRSVNSRYLEINLRLPQSLSIRENEIREMIRQKFGRGKVSAAVSTNDPKDEEGLTVNSESVARVLSMLKQLRKSAKISSPVRLEHLLAFKEMFRNDSNAGSENDQWEAVKSAVEAALTQLLDAKAAEGASLKLDLQRRIDGLNSEIEKINELAHVRTEEGKARLRQKVDELMKGKEIDPARVELEIVLLADKLDITEEVVRFKTHNDFFMKLLDGEDSNGRRLNFLLQEMNREANTMGAKAFDVEMSHLVVEMKEELERIREQVQNLE